MSVPLRGDPPPVVSENHSQQRVEYTTCYMCACRCGVKVTLEGNSVRFIQGTPDHPVNRGVLCAKGSAGIMKQNSPAKLHSPLLRRPGTPRGAGVFDAIGWDEALDLLTKRLRNIRATDPRKLAFFTGRDQMQALSSLWAQQFGTPNWAAHGGFCSVNMAAAGLYTIGYSFWEFGAPDWDRARYFVLWGVAEDHASNPIKIGLDKLKSRGAKFVSINPVRTGYSAIADEWIGIRPGTDGLLALSLMHVLLRRELFDREFLLRQTNAAALVIDAPGTSQHGLMLRNPAGETMVWDQRDGAARAAAPGVQPALFGDFTVGGRRCRTVMSLVVDRYAADDYAPSAVAARCGVSAETIERLALEMASVAFEQTIELPIRWTDVYGREHATVRGNPVAMFAMRGIAAHSNGFQTCRAIHLLQMLLGALEGPGNFRAKAPYPRPAPWDTLPANDAATMGKPDTPLARAPLGLPTRPEDLAIDAAGRPLRIDHAYSWESPLAAHGLMHSVIHNAVRGDPYPIDTLLLFMANMAWNSAMNTAQTQQMLTACTDDGAYKIPFIVVVDAFDSETVRFADLVLPDTTFLERYDAISLLDRPISEPDFAADAIRHPLLKPARDVRPWQDVLIDLAGRLQFPDFVGADGLPKYRGYEDFIINYERSPGIGFLAGWRGAKGDKPLVGEPNKEQWRSYIDNHSYFAHHWPESQQFHRHINRDYLAAAKAAGFISDSKPIVMQLYCEPLQTFRLAGQGLYDGPRPNDAAERQRLREYFDPLPIWYRSFGDEQADRDEYPFHAITQRPMMMYHSWDGQNGWLRQILAQNFLYMNADRARELGLGDDDWVWVESPNGRIRGQLRTMAGCERNTVWTWNATAKMAGAWAIDRHSREVTHGFLLNHLISQSLTGDANKFANADPITGQAAWYDLRVRIVKAAPGETGVWPKLEFPV
jgi:anaerobic selenocysteine-containing dehydrogenase